MEGDWVSGRKMFDSQILQKKIINSIETDTSGNSILFGQNYKRWSKGTNFELQNK